MSIRWYPNRSVGGSVVCLTASAFWWQGTARSGVPAHQANALEARGAHAREKQERAVQPGQPAVRAGRMQLAARTNCPHACPGTTHVDMSYAMVQYLHQPWHRGCLARARTTRPTTHQKASHGPRMHHMSIACIITWPSHASHGRPLALQHVLVQIAIPLSFLKLPQRAHRQ